MNRPPVQFFDHDPNGARIDRPATATDDFQKDLRPTATFQGDGAQKPQDGGDAPEPDDDTAKPDSGDSGAPASTPPAQPGAPVPAPGGGDTPAGA